VFVKEGLWPGLQFPREPLAKTLGAHHYIDSDAGNAAAELQKLGGARVILATAPDAKAISAMVDGLSVNGKLVVPAAPNDPLTVSAASLFLQRRSVAGSYAGFSVVKPPQVRWRARPNASMRPQRPGMSSNCSSPNASGKAGSVIR
jgi:threonine dehydrogenase-like Zn-dependent dehydrogenase